MTTSSKPSKTVKSPLKQLAEELAAAEPTAPINAQQALVLARAIQNSQAVLASVIQGADRQAVAINQNFTGIFLAMREMGEAIGIAVTRHTPEEEQAEVSEEDLPPPGTVKH